MDKTQALKLLIEAAKYKRQGYAVGYHSHEQGYKLDRFERDHKHYQQLTAAIEWAEAELAQTQEADNA